MDIYRRFGVESSDILQGKVTTNRKEALISRTVEQGVSYLYALLVTEHTSATSSSTFLRVQSTVATFVALALELKFPSCLLSDKIITRYMT